MVITITSTHFSAGWSMKDWRHCSPIGWENMGYKPITATFNDYGIELLSPTPWT